MADWKDRLQEGSFRGVPFFIDTSELSGGRRAVSHEFPDRDTPFAEDVGRKARSFPITGHILGDNYFLLRDRLIAACDQRGPGELIHPYHGSRNVQLTEFSVAESTTEGRIATFSFTFIEAGTFKFPTIGEDRANTLLGFSAESLENAKADFDKKFSVTKLPGFAVEKARSGVRAAADAFDSATSGIATSADDIANLAFSTRNLIAEVSDLIQKPADLANRLLNSLSLLSTVSFDLNEALKAYETLFGFDSDLDDIPNLGTSTRTQQKINEDALNDLIRRGAIIRSTEDVLGSIFFSVDDALNKRIELSRLIEDQIKDTDDDAFFQSMRDLNAVLVESLPDIETDLPSIIKFTPRITLPSLVIVHDLFDSLDNEQDLIDRNNIRHPGFVPGAKELEVISG